MALNSVVAWSVMLILAIDAKPPPQLVLYDHGRTWELFKRFSKTTQYDSLKVDFIIMCYTSSHLQRCTVLLCSYILKHQHAALTKSRYVLTESDNFDSFKFVGNTSIESIKLLCSIGGVFFFINALYTGS